MTFIIQVIFFFIVAIIMLLTGYAIYSDLKKDYKAAKGKVSGRGEKRLRVIK